MCTGVWCFGSSVFAPPPNSFILPNFKVRLDIPLQTQIEARIFHKNITSHIPGLADVDDVDTISTGLPEVVLHVNLKVLATEVALSSQQGLDVLAGGVHDGGQVGGSHFD